MYDFDPDRPSLLHDRQNDRSFVWNIDWADHWRRHAMLDKVDGTASFDGLVLDGWEPISEHS